uniref:CPG4 domain-containing protein n=1 Tax=Panagrellus redivivus TaxID=6233 RepID=A0A7E4ZTC2_PANRE
MFRSSLPCAVECYYNMVNHVSPIEIDGIVGMTIIAPKQNKFVDKYLSTLEQFQNVCWIYRDYAHECVKRCPRNRLTRRIVAKFFRGIHQYCIKDYDTIIQQWSCHQRTRKFRKLCDSECAYTCDRTCLFHCLRPVLRRACSSDSIASSSHLRR